jgi:hypothetical protein
MVKLSLKIYLLANLAVVMLLAAMAIPDLSEIETVFIVALVSFIITLPVIPALLLIFWLLGKAKQNIFIKWIWLLASIAACATIPTFLFESGRFALSGSFFRFSLLAAYLGVLFQVIPIHQYLINSYGKENPETV